MCHLSRLQAAISVALVVSVVIITDCERTAGADEPFIPRTQSKPPGPPLSPEEAIAKMVVPEGFHVELVAAEPDLINPVAMAFDDSGRVYVTESFEYPRREPGPGRDRIKILEDTNGDGRFDSVKIFAEGLNIPSGIAVGHGGVWVANAPDILFLEDTDGDDVADKTTVVVTGFGRDDTHELPNSLTWGPDGYLYGLNGVFNPSEVHQNGKTFKFTCAMFRIDPVTHRFELFCEGTSNPWGIAFDHEGEAFVSACVIDHLWHLTESGYYHRQGGPYPPHTWKIDSIVGHKHQMAAYCGIEFFDSPAYPAEYRDKLYMGNIHGGCINVDSVARTGSTYRGTPHPDFMTANDVWFMPVAQKVGPDGCLYVLDWYDRYHCYQDANADPKGVDRGHGRLHRIVYGKRPEIAHKDLGALADDRLVELLDDANIFYRQRASVILSQRLRAERGDENERLFASLAKRLASRVAQGGRVAQAAAEGGVVQRGSSMQTMATAMAAPQMTLEMLGRAVSSVDPVVVAWAVRQSGERLKAGDPAATERRGEILGVMNRLAAHGGAPVRLQVAIAAGKWADADADLSAAATDVLIRVLDGADDDGLLPRIVWKNLEPRLVANQQRVVGEIAKGSNRRLVEMAPRIATRLLADVKPDLSGTNDSQTLGSVLGIAASLGGDSSGDVLRSVATKLRTGEIRPAAARPLLRRWLQTAAGDDSVTWQLRSFAGDESAHMKLREMLVDTELPVPVRREVLDSVSVTHPAAIGGAVQQWLEDVEKNRRVDNDWRDAILTAVVRGGDAELQTTMIRKSGLLPVGVRAMVAGRMVQRESTATLLLDEIAAGRMSNDIIGPDSIRQLAASPSAKVREATQAIWGSVRLQDSPARQKVVRQMTDHLLGEAKGDARRGWVVYDRICGQCHVMHGRGYEVGPEITRNGRGNFEPLIVSVFDPSLVIGEAYKSVTVLTDDGRVISGLVTERSDQRIVLKVQGGKLEVVPMDTIDELRDNDQSLMPEGLEEQMTTQEMADLFALLSLENPPGTPDNRVIAGTPDGLHASSE